MVRLHTKTFCEVVIATCPEMVMASIRAHDAQVTFRECLKTWVTVALGKAFIGLTATGLAVDAAEKLQFDDPTNERIHRLHLVAKSQ